MTQNCNDNKIKNICFYSNFIFEIEIYKHKNLRKNYNKRNEHNTNVIVKQKKIILFVFFIFFQQFDKKTNNFRVTFNKSTIKIREI